MAAVTQPARILVVCYEYPPVGGGGGRIAASVAEGLAQRGHAVRVLTSRAPGASAEATEGGVSIRRAFAARRRLDRCSVAEMAAYAALHVLPARSEIARFRPDVVHAHFAVPSGAVAWLATRLGRTPYVITAHLGDVPGGAPEQTDHLFRLIKPATNPIWKKAAAVTAVATHVGELARAAYGRRPEIILNGLDMRNRATPAPRPAQEAVRVVWCGRMQAQKNLVAGVAALAPLRGRSWRLDIIGDGPLRQEVEAEAQRAGLAEHVAFKGWRTAAEVDTAMRAADVLFLPSLSEGLSLVTVEALRAGLALVISDIPGNRDVVIPGENGFACDLAWPESFAQGLGALIEDRDLLLRMRRASADRAQLFDAEHMVSAYERVLWAVLRGGRP